MVRLEEIFNSICVPSVGQRQPELRPTTGLNGHVKIAAIETGPVTWNFVSLFCSLFYRVNEWKTAVIVSFLKASQCFINITSPLSTNLQFLLGDGLR